MTRFQGKWSGLLAMTLLASSAFAQSQLTIDYLMSTKHDFESYMEVTNPKIAFGTGAKLNASIEATGDQPLQIGLDIDDSQTFQTVSSIGGSITDATGITLMDVRKNDKELYCEILNMLYSPDKDWLAAGGIGMNAARIPLGATDFSLKYYTLDDPQECGAEFKGDLEYFNLEGGSPKIWQVVKDIKELVEASEGDKRLSIRTLPWTVNPQAKTNKSYTGKGELDPKYEDYWVEYMYRSIAALCELELCPEWFSLQESPQHVDDTVPVMQIKPDQAARLAKALYARVHQDKALQAKFGDRPLALCALEASWAPEDLSYADKVLGLAGDAFGGVCWQGYVGYNATVQEIIADKYHKQTLFTEDTDVLSAEPWGNLRDWIFKVGVNAIQRGTSDVTVWQNVLKTNAEMTETSPSLKDKCKACVATILVRPEALGKYDSQSQHGFCTKDEARPDWLKVSDKIAANQPLDGEESTKLPQQVKDDGEVVPLAKGVGAANTEATTTHAKRDLGRMFERRQLPQDPTEATTAQKQTTAAKPLEPKECFKQFNRVFNYEPSHCGQYKPRTGLKRTKANYGPTAGAYVRTSQMDFLAQLAAATAARGGFTHGTRIALANTEQAKSEDVINGRVIATAFEQVHDGDAPDQSRFCVLALNWNDNDQKKFEPVNVHISFRGQTAELKVEPGVYTACWLAQSSKAFYGNPDNKAALESKKAANAETTDVKATNAETTDAKATNAETTDAKATNAETTNAESTNGKPTDTDKN